MTTENDMKGPDDILAAEYVLGVLPHAERVSFMARLETEENLQARVKFWETHLTSMADEVEPVALPENTLQKIERRIFETSPNSGTEAGSGWWSSLGFWRGLSIASLLAVLILGGLLTGIVKLPGDTDPETVYVAELTGEGGIVRMISLYDRNTGTLKVNRVEGAPGQGRSFELWLIEGDNEAISLGVLPVAVKGEIDIPENLRGKFAGAVLAISDEPEGGSPTGQATGPVVAVGKLTDL